jgi:hypothetical protein
MAMDKRGALWVSDQNSQEVDAYVAPFTTGITPVATINGSTGGGQLAPISLAYDSVGDTLMIGNCDPAGSCGTTNNVLQFDLGNGDTYVTGVAALNPVAIAVDPNAHIYVANKAGHVEVYASDLSSIQQQPGSTSPANPDALAIAPNVNPYPVTTPNPFGRLYVAETYPSGKIINFSYSFSTIGQSISSIQYGGSQGISGPSAMAFFDGTMSGSGAYANPRSVIKHKRVATRPPHGKASKQP